MRDHGADDSRDPALAVKHRRSGSTVVDHEAVIPLIDFKKGGAREPAVVRVLYEPARHGAWALVRIGERHDTIFWHKRRHPDCDAAGGGNGSLQFKHGQFFSVSAHQAPNADRNRLTVGTIFELKRFPLLCGKLHSGRNVCAVTIMSETGTTGSCMPTTSDCALRPLHRNIAHAHGQCRVGEIDTPFRRNSVSNRRKISAEQVRPRMTALSKPRERRSLTRQELLKRYPVPPPFVIAVDRNPHLFWMSALDHSRT